MVLNAMRETRIEEAGSFWRVSRQKKHEKSLIVYINKKERLMKVSLRSFLGKRN
ncbi:MAG: hypothetical protein ACI85I_000256 [Arenicella sp.]|jgi:hypothetical protein